MIYRLLGRLFPITAPPESPRRIVVLRPCCIGDVVIATAALQALRRAYPEAHITFAVSQWARPIVEGHPAVDEILDTGPAALPVKSPRYFIRFVRQLRGGQYDLAVSLVRSPLMSLAVWLSRIPYRVGLDSDGRGFGYNLRAPVSPDVPRHEAEIYLDAVRILGLDIDTAYPYIPVTSEAKAAVRAILAEYGIGERYVVINPAGGSNPGMVMDAKRWPVENFAALADWLHTHLSADIVLVGGPKDGQLIQQMQQHMQSHSVPFVGTLTFPEIAALAHGAQLYVGNDTGLTHFAAATGIRTVMILGPSDPARYAPYNPNTLAIWRPYTLSGGVNKGVPEGWTWQTHGITFPEALNQIENWLTS